MMGLLCLQMAVFVQVTEAKGKDSDGDGTPDVGKHNKNIQSDVTMYSSLNIKLKNSLGGKRLISD